MTTPQESTASLQSIESATDLNGTTSARGSDPDNPSWGLLGAFLVWLASLVLSVLLPVLLAVPYVSSHYPRGRVPKEALFADKTLVIILLAGLLLVHVLTLILAWIVVTRAGKLPAGRALGLSWPKGFGPVKSASLAILLYAVSFLINVRFGGQETELERMLQSSRAAALMMAFIAAVTAPLAEEIVYRGLLYSALQRLAGPVFAVIVVSSVFTGLHFRQYWPNLAVISSIALLSIVLTVTRARTRRLLPCYAIHLVFNGIPSSIIVCEPYLRALFHLPKA